MTEWQRIETAPRDGSDILVGWHGCETPMLSARWENGEFVNSLIDGQVTPTHWRRLPKPPPAKSHKHKQPDTR